MQTDQEFVDSMISSFKNIERGVFEWCVIVRGLDLAILYSSQIYKNVFHNGQEIADKFGFIKTTQKHLEEQHAVDLTHIIKQRKSVRNFVIADFDNKLQPFLLYKSPLINPDTNNVVGIFCTYSTFSFIKIQFQIMRSLELLDYAYDTDIAQFNLTTREKEAIFLFLSGLSSQNIADVLSKISNRNVSKSTIDSLFRDQLFLKFEVYNREGLFQKLLNLGFDRFVPAELLTKVELPVTELVAY